MVHMCKLGLGIVMYYSVLVDCVYISNYVEIKAVFFTSAFLYPPTVFMCHVLPPPFIVLAVSRRQFSMQP